MGTQSSGKSSVL